ncbi:MAG: ClpXP protease specificity-enhancing factor SspB, partial [Planctomycetota bacterium]
GVQVPLDFVKDGQIVLNIAPRAVSDFHMDTQGLGFNARFGGIPTDVYTPVHAIMGIYARENGKGMMFEKEEGPTDDDPAQSGSGKKPSKAAKPGLRVVK